MTSDRTKTAELISEIIETYQGFDQFYEEPEDPSVLGEPATAESLSMLERHWGRALPSSYRAVLELHDGITRFWLGEPLLSVEEIVRNEHKCELYEELVPEAWRWIVIMGDEPDGVALNFNNVGDDGEAEVIKFFVDGYEERFPSFLAFLSAYLEQTKAELAKCVADRAGLEDD